ncbi:MAG: DUF47 family protein [Candidatus Omnitrophota bacterium]
MLFNFIPQEFNFFDMFERQVGYAVEASDYFSDLVKGGKFDEAALKRIQILEHQGDDCAHAIIEQLNKTFITPFDREDIYALTKEIDDIIDMMNTIVNRLVVYKISGVDKNLVEFSRVIKDSVSGISAAVKALRNSKKSKVALESCVEVHRLENVGDAMRDKVLAELFETQKNDPIAVIKWKEIYEDSETLLDICEDVAHVVESILVKQA